MIYRAICVICAFMIFVFVVAVWMWYKDPQLLVTWWNNQIKDECNHQDSNPLNGIVSLHDVWDCPNNSALELHKLIAVNHDKILSEVLGYHNDRKVGTMRIKFMGEMSETSGHLPVLKNIASLFPRIPNINVSIIYPGTSVIENGDKYRMFHKYHYGLKVADNDVGLNISGYNVKWKEKEGFLLDGTLSHSSWNHTSEPRIVISADVFRDLSIINSTGSYVLYSMIRRIEQTETGLHEEAVMY